MVLKSNSLILKAEGIISLANNNHCGPPDVILCSLRYIQTVISNKIVVTFQGLSTYYSSNCTRDDVVLVQDFMKEKVGAIEGLQ